MLACTDEVQRTVIRHHQRQVHDQPCVGDAVVRQDVGAWAQHREADLRRVGIDPAQLDRLEQSARGRAAKMVGLETVAMPIEEQGFPRRRRRSASQMPGAHPWRHIDEVRQAPVFVQHTRCFAADIGESLGQALRPWLKERVVIRVVWEPGEKEKLGPLTRIGGAAIGFAQVPRHGLVDARQGLAPELLLDLIEGAQDEPPPSSVNLRDSVRHWAEQLWRRGVFAEPLAGPLRP